MRRLRESAICFRAQDRQTARRERKERERERERESEREKRKKPYAKQRSMSRMKHLLRKLHIGGSLNEHQRIAETRPVINPNPSPDQSSPAVAVAPPSAMGRVGGGEAVDRASVVAQDAAVDFSFLEEEFQVQLALAISASDPDARDDRETAQIKVAKRISLGCSPSTTDTETLVELLSLRYWVSPFFFFRFLQILI